MQRVREASVTIAGHTSATIGPGLLVLAGIGASDDDNDRDWLAHKIVALRIFDDDTGTMNRSIIEVGGEILAVSQFTLFASTKKGARPSWSAAAPPERAAPAFERFVAALGATFGKPVATGVFGATMQVALVNDGPVTIWLDSRQRD